jgi:hypothetical protein
MAVRTFHGEADRHAAAVGEYAPCGADLPAVGRMLADLVSPERGFGLRPVHGQPFPVNPLQGVVCRQTLPPQGKEDAGGRPLLEATVRRAPGTQACVLQRVPLALGAEGKEDGIHGPAIIDTRPVAPEWVRLPWWEQWLDVCPQFIGYPPITPNVLRIVTHGSSSYGREVFPHRISER